MISELWEAIGAFLISVAGVGLALSHARRTGFVDVPNQRSSHSVPTPRGGGIALVSAVLTVAIYDVARIPKESSPLFFPLLGAIVAVTFIGWIDDRASVRVAIRLGIHLVAGFAVALLVNEISPLPGFANIAWLVWWVFWTVASINIVNFMDGVDGMIATQGLVYGIFLLVLSSSRLGGHFGLIVAASCLGFLIWNWAPAKMFMGDVGSGPLGLFFVIGGSLALEAAPATLVFLPLFPLFLDALLTMLIRLRQREKLTDAHRSHLYQRLANGGYGHARVTTIYAVAASLGAILALSVKNSSPSIAATAIVFYAGAVLTGWSVLHKRFLESPTRHRVVTELE